MNPHLTTHWARPNLSPSPGLSSSAAPFSPKQPSSNHSLEEISGSDAVIRLNEFLDTIKTLTFKLPSINGLLTEFSITITPRTLCSSIDDHLKKAQVVPLTAVGIGGFARRVAVKYPDNAPNLPDIDLAFYFDPADPSKFGEILIAVVETLYQLVKDKYPYARIDKEAIANGISKEGLINARICKDVPAEGNRFSLIKIASTFDIKFIYSMKRQNATITDGLQVGIFSPFIRCVRNNTFVSKDETRNIVTLLKQRHCQVNDWTGGMELEYRIVHSMREGQCILPHDFAHAAAKLIAAANPTPTDSPLQYPYQSYIRYQNNHYKIPCLSHENANHPQVFHGHCIDLFNSLTLIDSWNNREEANKSCKKLIETWDREKNVPAAVLNQISKILLEKPEYSFPLQNVLQGLLILSWLNGNSKIQPYPVFDSEDSLVHHYIGVEGPLGCYYLHLRQNNPFDVIIDFFKSFSLLMLSLNLSGDSLIALFSDIYDTSTTKKPNQISQLIDLFVRGLDKGEFADIVSQQFGEKDAGRRLSLGLVNEPEFSSYKKWLKTKLLIESIKSEKITHAPHGLKLALAKIPNIFNPDYPLTIDEIRANIYQFSEALINCSNDDKLFAKNFIAKELRLYFNDIEEVLNHKYSLSNLKTNGSLLIRMYPFMNISEKEVEDKLVKLLEAILSDDCPLSSILIIVEIFITDLNNVPPKTLEDSLKEYLKLLDKGINYAKYKSTPVPPLSAIKALFNSLCKNLHDQVLVSNDCGLVIQYASFLQKLVTCDHKPSEIVLDALLSKFVKLAVYNPSQELLQGYYQFIKYLHGEKLFASLLTIQSAIAKDRIESVITWLNLASNTTYSLKLSKDMLEEICHTVFQSQQSESLVNDLASSLISFALAMGYNLSDDIVKTIFSILKHTTIVVDPEIYTDLILLSSKSKDLHLQNQLLAVKAKLAFDGKEKQAPYRFFLQSYTKYLQASVPIQEKCAFICKSVEEMLPVADTRITPYLKRLLNKRTKDTFCTHALATLAIIEPLACAELLTKGIVKILNIDNPDTIYIYTLKELMRGEVVDHHPTMQVIFSKIDVTKNRKQEEFFDLAHICFYLIMHIDDWASHHHEHLISSAILIDQQANHYKSTESYDSLQKIAANALRRLISLHKVSALECAQRFLFSGEQDEISPALFCNLLSKQNPCELYLELIEAYLNNPINDRKIKVQTKIDPLILGLSSIVSSFSSQIIIRLHELLKKLVTTPDKARFNKVLEVIKHFHRLPGLHHDSNFDQLTFNALKRKMEIEAKQSLGDIELLAVAINLRKAILLSDQCPREELKDVYLHLLSMVNDDDIKNTHQEQICTFINELLVDPVIFKGNELVLIKQLAALHFHPALPILWEYMQDHTDLEIHEEFQDARIQVISDTIKSYTKELYKQIKEEFIKAESDLCSNGPLKHYINSSIEDYNLFSIYLNYLHTFKNYSISLLEHFGFVSASVKKGFLYNNTDKKQLKFDCLLLSTYLVDTVNFCYLNPQITPPQIIQQCIALIKINWEKCKDIFLHIDQRESLYYLFEGFISADIANKSTSLIEMITPYPITVVHKKANDHSYNSAEFTFINYIFTTVFQPNRYLLQDLYKSPQSFADKLQSAIIPLHALSVILPQPKPMTPSIADFIPLLLNVLGSIALSKGGHSEKSYLLFFQAHNTIATQPLSEDQRTQSTTHFLQMCTKLQAEKQKIIVPTNQALKKNSLNKSLQNGIKQCPDISADHIPNEIQKLISTAFCELVKQRGPVGDKNVNQFDGLVNDLLLPHEQTIFYTSKIEAHLKMLSQFTINSENDFERALTEFREHLKHFYLYRVKDGVEIVAKFGHIMINRYPNKFKEYHKLVHAIAHEDEADLYCAINKIENLVSTTHSYTSSHKRDITLEHIQTKNALDLALFDFYLAGCASGEANKIEMLIFHLKSLVINIVKYELPATAEDRKLILTKIRRCILYICKLKPVLIAEFSAFVTKCHEEQFFGNVSGSKTETLLEHLEHEIEVDEALFNILVDSNYNTKFSQIVKIFNWYQDSFDYSNIHIFAKLVTFYKRAYIFALERLISHDDDNLRVYMPCLNAFVDGWTKSAESANPIYLNELAELFDMIMNCRHGLIPIINDFNILAINQITATTQKKTALQWLQEAYIKSPSTLLSMLNPEHLQITNPLGIQLENYINSTCKIAIEIIVKLNQQNHLKLFSKAKREYLSCKMNCETYIQPTQYALKVIARLQNKITGVTITNQSISGAILALLELSNYIRMENSESQDLFEYNFNFLLPVTLLKTFIDNNKTLLESLLRTTARVFEDAKDNISINLFSAKLKKMIISQIAITNYLLLYFISNSIDKQLSSSIEVMQTTIINSTETRNEFKKNIFEHKELSIYLNDLTEEEKDRLLDTALSIILDIPQEQLNNAAQMAKGEHLIDLARTLYQQARPLP